jgi:DNA-binding XRE family transcriptional regulator
MRPSSCKSTLTVMRSVAGLTQQRLADLIGCSRMSIQQIELGRLKLSDKMAEKISFHTGIDMNWLLGGDYKAPPVCLPTVNIE